MKELTPSHTLKWFHVSPFTQCRATRRLLAVFFALIGAFRTQSSVRFCASKNVNLFIFNTVFGSFPLFSIFFAFCANLPPPGADLEPPGTGLAVRSAYVNYSRLPYFRPRVKRQDASYPQFADKRRGPVGKAVSEALNALAGKNKSADDADK
jgi:hypothetical protein